MSKRRRLIALAAVAALPVVSGGCYTIFHNPARIAALGTETEDARLAGYYPYSPTVWGWYYGHYGPYWSYYAYPWWMSGHHGGHHVPDEDGFVIPSRGDGFDRGGRGGVPSATGGFAHPETTVPIAPPDPPRQSTTTVGADGSGSGTDDGGKPEKPKEEPKPANVGGRGGRR